MAEKLTPEEIIKALKKHSMNLCSECKVQKTTLCNDCISEIQRNTLDLINRQKAEIERFKKIETTVNSFWGELQKLAMFKYKEMPTLEELLEYIENRENKAIKDFAEGLHTEINRVRGDIVQERSERLGQIESSDIFIPFDSVLHGYNSKLEAYDHINGFVDLQYKEMVGE